MFLGVVASTVVILAVALPLTTGVASAWSSPTLSTTAQSSADNVAFSDVTGPIALNSYVRDTALLSGAATPTTGSVLYTLYSGTSCDGNTPTGSVVFSDTETLASNTIPASMSFQVTTAGTYQWQAVYTSGNSQNNDATSPCGSETFTVTTPNFTVTKTDVPGDGGTVVPGATIPYTVTISNVGNGAGSAVIADVVPSNLTVSGTPACAVTSPDTCSVANPSGSTWTFSVSLESGDTATVTFSAVVSPTDTATVVNTATITSGICMPTTTVQCSSTVSNPVAVLSVVKSSTPASGSTVALGSTVSYGLTLSNAGTAAATGITVTDAVPAGTTYVDSSASCGGATGCTVTEANSTVTWTGITVQPGSTNALTLTFKVTVNANDTNGEVIPNFAVFTNVGTPTCTTATCNTNTVTVTVTVSVPVTAPATMAAPPTAPPVVTQPSTIAFTGANIGGKVAAGLALLGLGGFLVALSRRRRREQVN